MTTPETTAPLGDHQAPEATGRRPRRLGKAGLAIVAVGVLIAATGCTPEGQARRAVEAHWPASTVNCAMRVVNKESSYQADARSPGGGNLGLFQINSVHRSWIANTYGYRWEDLTDPVKNAQVARGLAADSQRRTGDQWAPWRFSGASRTGCPA